MTIIPIKTERISSTYGSLIKLLDASVSAMREKTVLVITSKVVSLCEQRVVSRDVASKEELVEQEAEAYTGAIGRYGFHFTITNHTLIPSAGIDESNSDNKYVLWPEDTQRTANEVREYLIKRFDLSHVGVLITDSTCTPMRLGTMGIALAHSGFLAQNNYVGTPDLFGRPFLVSQSNVAGGLAAAAVVCMGEGIEQTPLAIVSDVSFVQFQTRNPSIAELKNQHIAIEDDIFAPFLQGIDWKQGDHNK
jgi:putative folate metabolism gamma-glutamate ligase